MLIRFIEKCLAPISTDRKRADHLVRKQFFSDMMSSLEDLDQFQVQANMLNYTGTTLFQRSILFFMTSLMQDVQQVRQLRRVFEQMDKD